MHNGLGHQIAHSLVDDSHIGVHQVADGFYLPLQLRVHGVHETVRAALLTVFTLLHNTAVQQYYTNYSGKRF